MSRQYQVKFYVSAFLVLAWQHVAPATIYYVKAGSSGTGTSWTNAYGTVPNAMTPAGSGDQVWVAGATGAGLTYYPTSGTDPTVSIQLESGVEVYGGFRGQSGDEGTMNSTTRPLDSSGRPTYLSILSGEIGATNSYHVVTANGVSSSALLDGFIIQDGYASGSNVSAGQRKGAIFITGTTSSPKIANCVVRNNYAGQLGGGLATHAEAGYTGSIRITNCVFEDNLGVQGGGACYIKGGTTHEFDGCSFSGNSTTSTSNGPGGALYFPHLSIGERTVRLSNCDFSDNSTVNGAGGAVYYSDDDDSVASGLTVRGGSFTSNTAGNQFGGGLYASTGSVFSSNVYYGTLFVNCTFIANQSGWAGGGAFGEGDGDHRFVNCQFSGNSSDPSGLGYSGGGLSTGDLVSFLDVTNCLVFGNSAYNAGGIYCGGKDQHVSRLTNVTVAYNDAINNFGGVSFHDDIDDPVTVVNTILYGNTDGNMGHSTSVKQIGPQVANPSVTYSDVQGGYSGTGNIDADPLFVDAANGNYRLQPCSLASDAADYSQVPADAQDVNGNGNFSEKTPDLDKLDRAVDNAYVPPNGSPFTYPDMGAYENNAVAACAMMGDLEVDSTVDGLDIQPFTDCVLAPTSGCACADLDLSGTITLADVPYFVQCLLTEGQNCGVVCVAGLRSYPDCNTNGVSDINDIFNGTSQDCNHNDVPDECDLDAGDPDGNELVSADVNSNSIPDECEPDCNTNGVPDDWDISQTTSDDVNTNGVPDECEIDCNHNSIPDDWDIAQQTSPDCNVNGKPDECEADCNHNDVPDDCDIDPGDPDGNELVSADCNGNGWPDECDLAMPGGWGSLDCNTNGIPDECDIASCESDPACGDCNENGIPDACDIAAEISEDADTNGIPDECEGEGFMGGGGESSMMSGGEGGEDTGGTPMPPEEEAAWEAYYEWAAAQCWGPACEDPTDAQFAAMVAKLRELGLPVTGHPGG